MIKKQKRKRMKIRRTHIFISLFIFLILTAAIGLAVGMLITTFSRSAVESKLADKVSLINRMSSLYESQPDHDAAAERISGYADDFFILGSDGDIDYIYGENTCDLSSNMTYFSPDSEMEYRLYSDENAQVISADGSSDIQLNYTSFISFAAERISEKKMVNSLMTGSDVGAGNRVVNVPLWIARDLGSGGRMLFVKTSLSVNINDIIAYTRAAAFSAIAFLTVFIVMLISMINTIATQNRLTRMVFTDPTTGGKNKSWFLVRGEQSLTKFFNARNRYAVFSLDVVKYLNFCICHSISEGERMLSAIGSAVRNAAGKKCISAHFDSSDFGVLVRVADENEMHELAQRIMTAAERASQHYKPAFHLGAYMIDVVTDAKGRVKRRRRIDLEEYYNNACTARETLDGTDDSGIAFFDQKLIDEKKWISTVRDKQQTALEQEEFVVYYQPKYDPRTDRLRGAEALIRWQSPEYGFITPYRFIPIFEKNGFITEIDHYMIEHVARDQKRWLDAGLNCVPVSVNVSRSHFAEPDLAEQIRDIVDRAGTPHSLIEIELTESAFFDDKKAMLRTIEKLKEYGFTVSMDDFGSGYSSLNSLKDMPLDVLKLDAEFFRGDNADERGRIVVAEAIQLARSLNMRTVAEGVEAKDQVEFLAEQNCDMIQGYYYAKPMPSGEYEQRMTTADKK